MIVSWIAGGLGNQLFQYATGYALARRLNTDLYLDTSFYGKQDKRAFKLDYFKISYAGLSSAHFYPRMWRIANSRVPNKMLRTIGFVEIGENNKYILEGEKEGELIDRVERINSGNAYLHGYFQNEDFFRNYRCDLLKQLVPITTPSSQYMELEGRIAHSESVFVHIRRGDFINDSHPYHYVLNARYYHRALDYIRSERPHSKVFVFSNDIEGAKRDLHGQRIDEFVELRSEWADVEELMLMTKCKHGITANSTFSWWGAWLSKRDGIVIVPNKAYAKQGMIPSRWIKVDCAS